MIDDLRSAEDGTEFAADLCIIGGGAAGITLAREFIGTKSQVILVESGGLDYEEETQSLYIGENTGLPYFDLDVTRLRYFGGTTNHWSGRCAPLDEIDFRKRSWVPYSGWPLTRAELDPYYERANPLIGLGENIYDERVWDELGIDAPRLNSDKARVRFWRFSARRFGSAFRAELEAAENIRILLNANVTNIQSTSSVDAVDYVDITTLDGIKGRVRARNYVLAAGGIENPRLLLASNSIAPVGLGNQNDLVGRFFMEHPHATSGTIVATDPGRLLETYRRHYPREDVEYWPALCMGDRAQEQSGVLNSALALYYKPRRDSGLTAAKSLGKDFGKLRWPENLGEKLLRIAGDLDDAAIAVYRHFWEGKPLYISPGLLFFRVRAEQEPNPESRVRLSHERDALGNQRADLDWRMTALDKRSVAAVTRTIGEELGRLDLGRVKLEDWLLDGTDDWPEDDLDGGHHHMGTTRMSDDPKQGVVDANARVHGIANLFVAGSSVFPTSGWANPTLTIVALSLRLADHLKSTTS